MDGGWGHKFPCAQPDFCESFRFLIHKPYTVGRPKVPDREGRVKREVREIRTLPPQR